MPIYEYRCQECGTKFEKLVRRASESPEAACPSCHGTRLTLELSVFSAHSGGSKSVSQPMCPSGGPCTCGPD